MVDRRVLAAKTAAVNDAVRRIREVLPADAAAFRADRSAREIVILNLFVAIQDCVSLATHCLSDGGWTVPSRFADVFLALADQGIVAPELAQRMAEASGLRNLIAHQYGDLDPDRLFAIATTGPDDLLAFCGEVAKRVA